MKLKNTTDGIPGGFQYISPETGVIIGPTSAFADLVKLVRIHDRANALADTPAKLIEEQICARQPEICRESTESEREESMTMDSGETIVLEGQAQQPAQIVPPKPAKPKLPSVKDVVKATKALSRWTIGGRKKVTPEHAAQRAKVCFGCPKHVGIQDCPACTTQQLHNAISLVVGRMNFTGRDALKVCGACGCSLKAKVQLPIDYLREQNEDLPAHCWIKTEDQ